MERPCCDKRRTFNRLEDAWAVVWGGEGGTGRVEPSPNFRRSERLWEVAQVGGCGTRSPRGVHPLHSIHSPLSACAGAYVHPRPAVCRALPRLCIHGGERERELSSGYLIARVNKFTHTFFLVQCCESLILFLYAEREKIYDVYFKISSRLYYSWFPTRKIFSSLLPFLLGLKFSISFVFRE